jgi:signal transduction histidine kinase
MQRGSVPDQGTVEIALAEWRQKAANVLMTATAVVYVPPFALFLAGRGPEFAWLIRAILCGVYAVTVLCALLRRVDYRKRAWVFMAASYLLMVAGNIANPQGTFVRALPVVLPMFMMVLFGAWLGRVATVASIVVLLIAPIVHTQPCLVGILTVAPTGDRVPPHIILFQGIALMALLSAPMVLLDRFHRFLTNSLASWEREARERAAAYRNLEREMLERRRLEREIARVGDDERHSLGLDIHDGVCQELTGALLRSEALVRRTERGSAPTVADLSAISSLIESAIDEAHAVAKGLCPLDPGPESLSKELAALAKRTQHSTGLACRFTATGDTTVPDPMTARHLYRIAQEALSNAVRHAHAERISVELKGTADTLVLQVEDDGCGMPTEVTEGRMGLHTMTCRAHILGSNLTVTPAPEGGTRVYCRVQRGHSGMADGLATAIPTTEETDHGH